MQFVDEASIIVEAGKGGNGCLSFRREKYVPKRGPDGGDGGHGGSVYLIGDESLNTLIDFKYQRFYKAQNGQPGQGRQMSGRAGEDLHVKVPVGTTVIDEDTLEVIADVTAEGQVVLVAQDLASYGRDQGEGERAIVPLVEAVADLVDRVRLLYLYPSDLTDRLVATICATGVPYFDLSLQHVSPPLMRRMRRWGDSERFLERIAHIRCVEPEAALRSNFIVGYPGETEEDHDALLAFVEAANLDWCGFFAFSREEGTHAASLDGEVAPSLVAERLHELGEIQDRITANRRDALIGRTVTVLVDEPGVGRTHREAPEIDGIVIVPSALPVGRFADVTVTGALGPDLVAA